MSWDLIIENSDYDKMTMVIGKLGYPVEEGLYEYTCALGSGNSFYVSRVKDDDSKYHALTYVPLENLKDDDTFAAFNNEFYCVVSTYDGETSFDFMYSLQDLKEKIVFIKNHLEDKEAEKLYFIKEKDLMQIPYASLEDFLNSRTAAEEEAEARY